MKYSSQEITIKRLSEIIDVLRVNLRKITQETNVKRYIGIDLIRDLSKSTIKLSQTQYATQYVNKHVPPEANARPTPLALTLDYTGKGDGSLPSIQPQIGELRFLADRTRPDILPYLGDISGSPDKPTANQVKGLNHIGKYLKGTLNDGITLGGDDLEVLLFGFTDSSFRTTGKHRSGYTFYLNKTSGTIQARSIKENLIAHHSCESEIFAADRTVRQSTWLRGFLDELGYPQIEPTVIWLDNQAAKVLIDTYKLGTNVAHLVLRLNYLHQEVLAGTVQFKYIESADNVADIQTKILPLPLFTHLKGPLLSGFGGANVRANK